MTAPQPIPDDELAAIKARAEAVDRRFTYADDARRVLDHDVPRLVAEVETLRARVSELQEAFDSECAHRDEEYAARNERP